jgi:2-oxoacid:acceptor oxidoreductase gamma subunit (pyruvate/2-ketoisovalerate family)
MSPIAAIERLQAEMEPYFPIKVFKDEIETRPSKTLSSANPKDEDIINVLGVNDDSRLFEEDKSYIEAFKNQKIRVAGFGGQGVLMAGVTLAQLGMENGLDVTWLPSYGPEMRGGTANCHVVLSNKEVGTPLVESPNVLIAMNSPSLDEFLPQVEKGGLVVVNSSIVEKKVSRDDVKAIYVPMTEIAESLGLRAAANMVAVTAYLTFSGVMKMDQLKKMIETSFKKKELIPKNMEVIDKAHEYVKQNCL